MSSYDGGGFDEWVEDSFFTTLTQEQWSQIKELLEPYRQSIDDKLENDYDPEAMSWRTYRNSLWLCIPDEVNQKIGVILRLGPLPSDNS